MIEETLLRSNYIGKDGFIWWLGQVAPPESWDISEKVDIDPTKHPNSWAYRCKVRIIGYHTFDRNILPDKDLPWAHIMLGATDGNAQGGLGKTHKIVGGETVFGFFLDGDDAQQPVVIGVLYKNHNVKNFDIDEIAFKPFSGTSTGSRVVYGQTKQPIINSELSDPPETSSENVESDIIGGMMKDPITSNFTYSAETDKFFPFDQALNIAYSIAQEPIIVSENGCDNNIIGKITREIKNFIAIVSGLEKSLNLYVNTTLNTFVDITQEIRRTATIILGSVKFLINNMRNMIMKMIGCLFSKFVGLIIPIPQQPIVGEATKNILNIIFCLFEKIIDRLLPFLEEMLKGLVGRATNSPLCAVEEFVASIMNNVIDTIDELLAPVLSGLDWLMSGVSQVSSLLSQANSIATQLFNLIGCDNLKCQTPSEWALSVGPNKSEYDNWNRVVDKMNSIRSFNSDLNKGINSLSIYGGSTSLFTDCSDKVKNPKSQDDIPNNTKKGSKCIPPEIKIYGGDGVGASAIAVVGKNGSILSIEVLTQGFGFTKPPKIKIVDKTNYGSGATARSTIENGKLTRIYLTSSGSGYCKTNLDKITKIPFYLVKSDRYSIYEGESCTFTIETVNVSDGTKLSYRIGGSIRSDDIESPTTGEIEIFQNKSEITIQTRQDDSREIVEELVFDVLDQENNNVARTIVLVNDKVAPVLQIPQNQPNQSPPGTSIPNESDTDNTNTIDELVENIIIDTDNPIDINNPIGTIVDVVIDKPGIGYTSGDTINIGGCVFSPILTTSGSIVGIKDKDICPNTFDELPDYIIDTNTGIGAEISPVLSYVKPIDIKTTVNQFGIISVVDCV
jgi:hypothetical protein